MIYTVFVITLEARFLMFIQLWSSRKKFKNFHSCSLTIYLYCFYYWQCLRNITPPNALTFAKEFNNESYSAIKPDQVSLLTVITMTLSITTVWLAYLQKEFSMTHFLTHWVFFDISSFKKLRHINMSLHLHFIKLQQIMNVISLRIIFLY